MKNTRYLKVFLFIYFIICVQKSRSQNRPQTPKEPFPYQSIEVNYQVKSDTSVHLAATLTIPKGKAPFPAI